MYLIDWTPEDKALVRKLIGGAILKDQEYADNTRARLTDSLDCAKTDNYGVALVFRSSAERSFALGAFKYLLESTDDSIAKAVLRGLIERTMTKEEQDALRAKTLEEAEALDREVDEKMALLRAKIDELRRLNYLDHEPGKLIVIDDRTSANRKSLFQKLREAIG